jgi:hypothetical protein
VDDGGVVHLAVRQGEPDGHAGVAAADRLCCHLVDLAEAEVSLREGQAGPTVTGRSPAQGVAARTEPAPDWSGDYLRIRAPASFGH